jgi:hypothetical protein
MEVVMKQALNRLVWVFTIATILAFTQGCYQITAPIDFCRTNNGSVGVNINGYGCYEACTLSNGEVGVVEGGQCERL